MKTHLPTGLRKALIAAIFAVPALAYNAQADTYDLNNKRTGEAPTYYSVGGLDHYVDGTGYTDLTISGTACTAGTVRIYAHDYDYYPLAPDEYHDRNGDSIDINVDAGSNGVYEFSSIRVYDDGDGSCPNHSANYDFGFGSHSDGNLTITGSAKVSVSHGVDADGALTVKNNGQLTGDTSVEAGSVSVLNGEIAVKSLFTDDGGIELDDHGVLKATNGNITSETGISVTEHSRISAENGNITASDGNITVSEYSQVSAANGTVKASGTVKADGTNSSVTAVDMKGTNLTADNGGHLEATNMEGAVSAQHAGSVNATTITGNVLADGAGSEVTATNITGNVTAKDAGTVNATTITGSATADNATLTATTITNGASAVNGGTLTAANISGGASTTTGGTIRTDKQISGSVSGSNGVIAATAGQGLTITDNLEADGDTLITGAGETITIGTTGAGDISGNGNFIGSSADHSTVVASNIQVKGDIHGDSNNLSATGANLASGVNVIAADAVSGNSNTLRVTDHGDVSIAHNIAGNDNSVTVEGDGNIIIGGSISGDWNELETQGTGHITVDGTVGRPIDTTVPTDKGATDIVLHATDGDISIGNLSDNKGLSVGATAGSVTVQTAANAALTASDIYAKDDVTIGDITAYSTTVLGLKNTDISSDDGSVSIGQDTHADGSSISAGKDVTLSGGNAHHLHDSSVEAGRNIIVVDMKNSLTGETALTAAKNVDIVATDGDNTLAGADGINISVTAQTGIIALVAAKDNSIDKTTVSAAKNVKITATKRNLVTDSSITSEGQSVHLTSESSKNILSGSAVEALKNISLDAKEGNELTSSSLSVGNAIHINSEGGNSLASGTELMADEGNVTITATAGDNAVQGSGTVVKATQGSVIISASGDNTVSDLAVVNGGKKVSIAGTDNTVESAAAVVAGSTVTLTGTTNTITGTDTAVRAAGTDVAEGADSVTITGDTTVSDGAEVYAETGNLTIDGTDNGKVDIAGAETYVHAGMNDVTLTGADVTVQQKAQVHSNEGDVSLSGTTNHVLDMAVVKADETVTIEGTTNTISAASVTAKGTSVAAGEDAITMTGTNTIINGATVTADKGDITMENATVVKDSATKVTATNGDIKLNGIIAAILHHAAAESVNGDVTLSAAENKVLSSATVEAGGKVSIGTSDSTNTIDNADISGSRGVTLAGTTTATDSVLKSSAGDVTIKDTATVANTTLTAAGHIDVTADSELNLKEGTANALDGKVKGAGTINADTDNLNLSKDDTAFTGTLNMSGADKLLTVSDKGVGAAATVNLTNGADLTVTPAAGSSLGKLTAGAGSEVRLNPGNTAGTASATDLNMAAGSSLHIDADANSADKFTVKGKLSMATPGTVYVNAGNQGSLAAIAGDVTHTVIALAPGAVNNGVSEDVRYDMDSTGKQRVLQNKNMSLVSTKDGVQLVISDNFRGVAALNPNAAAVNETLKGLSAAVDHSGSTLADSASELDHVLDALDNTRSTADTKAALQSLNAAGNLVVTNMMMDSSRHHLSALRGQLNTPVCRTAAQGEKNAVNNVWVAYTGGHDNIGSDANLGKYNRNYQGALLGVDRSLSCNVAVGMSLGYENSRAHIETTRAEDDALFFDLYATAKTGSFNHRFSVGLGWHDMDVKRSTTINAAGHSYYGNSTGSVDAYSVNLGYELSYDVKLSEVSTLTPFASVDVAIHQLDTLTENGQGDASVVTNYDDPVQVDVAAGVAYTRTFRSFTADSSALSVSSAIHGELSKHRPTADNHFIGGGQSWKIRSSERTPIYGEIGASVAVPVYKTTSVIGGGSFEFSEDRVSVGGNIGVNVKF